MGLLSKAQDTFHSEIALLTIELSHSFQSLTKGNKELIPSSPLWNADGDASTPLADSEPGEHPSADAQGSIASQMSFLDLAQSSKEIQEAENCGEKDCKKQANTTPTQLYCPGRIIHITRNIGK